MLIDLKLPFALSIMLCLTACSKTQGHEPETKETAAATSVIKPSVRAFKTEELETAVNEAILKVMEAEHIPGAAVVVVKDGKTILKRGYGLANVETGRAVDPDKTLFRIGSVSKALTALAVTRLADQGKISLKDNVADYFEGFSDIPNTSGNNEAVKIRHLITHTSGLDQIGIGRQIWSRELPLKERKAMRPSINAFLKDNNLRRTSPPGLHYRYDTYGLTLAGAVLGNASQMSYGEAMKAEFFRPVGMMNSFVEAEPGHLDDLAIGYGYVDGKYVAQPYEIYMSTPASSIDATPADMGLLLEALTGDGKSTFGRLFSAKMTKQILGTQFRPHPDFPGVTHGLMEFPTADDLGRHKIRTIGHGGSMVGFRTSFTVLPELNIGYFIIANRNSEGGGGRTTLHGKVSRAILDIIHEGKTATPFAVPDINTDIDLKEFTGTYYYGVFCQTCTQEEFNRGGWPKRRPVVITASENGLKIRDKTYRPLGTKGVFVSTDGLRKVHFGRNKKGEVVFFSYNSSPDTFERVNEN